VTASLLADEPSAVLSVRGLRKTFPGVVALDAVDFDVREGEIHALLGANGAGKSTLIKVVAGLYAVDEGEIVISGRKVEFGGTSDAMAAGVSVIYQDFALVPHLTVAENIFLGAERRTSLGFVDWSATHREARTLLDRVGAPFSTDALVAELGTGHRQLVEIAKALRRDSKILILDEPTAALSQGESNRLFELIRTLAAKGVGIVYVSHRLEEIASLVGRVTILRDGRSMGTFPASELDRRKIVSLITGQRELRTRQRRKARVSQATPVLETKGLCRKGEFQDVSIAVRPGEVVVLTGLIGAGRTELLQTIFSARRAERGEILFNGNRTANGTVRGAIGKGIALIPEDRRGQGLCVILPVHENMAMAVLRQFLGALGLSWRRQIDHARKLIADLNIRPPTPFAVAGALSGGNQQKVVLAKWLSTDANLFMFDEPTQGVDVGAKSEIYDAIDRLAERDKAVLIASSDLEEVLVIADRVIAMHEGRVVAEFSNESLEASAIMDAITRGPAT
jgi:ribose transport system ATP-binding protein